MHPMIPLKLSWDNQKPDFYQIYVDRTWHKGEVVCLIEVDADLIELVIVPISCNKDKFALCSLALKHCVLTLVFAVSIDVVFVADAFPKLENFC